MKPQLEGHTMMNDRPRNQSPQRPMSGHVRQPMDDHQGHVRQPMDDHSGRNRPVRGEPFQPRDGPIEGATGNVENFHQNANLAPQSMKREGESASPTNYQPVE